MAKICIVLATYNGKNYLAQMLDSLEAQTRPADLIVAVDDGSKDESADILKSYANRLPLQITVLPKNGGHRAAFAKALELARPQINDTDFIALADQDDIWLPHKLELLEKEIGEASLIFGDAQVIDGKGKVTHESWRQFAHIQEEVLLKHQIAGINNVTGCTCLFKASLIKSILPIPQAVTVHDRWIAMIAQKTDGVKSTSKAVIQYRIHENNAVGGKQESSMESVLKSQQSWVKMILENRTLLNLDHSEISFAENFLDLLSRRLQNYFAFKKIFWIINNRHFLFLPSSNVTLFKRILFSTLGLPLVTRIWKNK